MATTHDVKPAGHGVLITGNRCYRCSHEWQPLNTNDVPRLCPKCKNPYWDRPRRDARGTNSERPGPNDHSWHIWNRLPFGESQGDSGHQFRTLAGLCNQNLDVNGINQQYGYVMKNDCKAQSRVL